MKIKNYILLFALSFFYSVNSYGFNNGDLLAILLNNPVTQKPTSEISELIPALPTELRTNFTFVYESRSPFKDSISHDYPRVILYSSDGKFVITYTGDPNKPGHNLVETMTFDDKTSKFKMSIFDLDEKNKLSKKIKTSSCNSCHGEDIRPIFDSYPLWPGFYGSVLDSFPKNISAIDKEKKRYQNFLSSVNHKKAYSDLLFNKESEVTPYLETSKLLLNENNEAVNPDSRFKPNERLGIALTYLNKKRIFNKLKKSNLYKEKRKEILYELLDCGGSKVNPERQDKILSDLTKENNDRIDKMKVTKDEREHMLLQMQELLFVRETAQLDWMADLLKIDHEDWSMALEKNSWSFFDGILSGVHEKKSFYMKEDFIYEILQDLANEEPSYSSFFSIGYNLEHYDLPTINKIDWDSAVKACKPLGKELLASRFKLHRRAEKSALKNISNNISKLIVTVRSYLE